MSWGRRDRVPLFCSVSGFDVQHSAIERLAGQIAALSEERILNTDPDALVQYFVDDYHVAVPELDIPNITAMQHEREIEVYDAFDQRAYRVSGVAFDIEIPFSGDAEVFNIRPNSYDSGPPHGEISGNFIKFTVQDRALSGEQVKSAIDSTVDSIQKYLGWHKEFWLPFDQNVAAAARQHIIQRRERLLQQKGAAANLAGLGIKLKEKPGDPKTFVAPVLKQNIKPQLPPMKTATPPDPTLDRAQYDTILTLVRGAGRSIEQSSSRTRNLDEEALRDMFLVPLNAHFGSATGETFNAEGKTDILIRHEGGNLFVAECKFWGGEKKFIETIDQLIGYLTWRDTKTAIVIFNRNKDFSSVPRSTKRIDAEASFLCLGAQASRRNKLRVCFEAS